MVSQRTTFKHVDHGLLVHSLNCVTTPTGRFYYPETGEQYPSVTTVLSSDNKEGLEAWKKRVGEEEARKISIQATNRGSAVHLLAEHYLNNVPDYAKGSMPINQMTFDTLRPILDARVNNIWFQEVPLYSHMLKTAGRVDLIAEFDGKLSVIDFKTSRKPKKVEWITSYFCQESFYAAAFYEMYNIPIRQIVTLVTVDESTAQVFIEQPFTWLPKFISMRNHYRHLNGI